VYYSTLTGSLLDLLDLDRSKSARPAGHPGGTQLHRRRHQAVLAQGRRQGGNVSLTYGSYDRVDARASGDFTLCDDKLFCAVAGVSKNRDGYVDRIDYGCTHPGSGVPTLGCRRVQVWNARAASRTPPAA
jgi:iron complex outermembrane receptor protein